MLTKEIFLSATLVKTGVVFKVYLDKTSLECNAHTSISLRFFIATGCM